MEVSIKRLLIPSVLLVAPLFVCVELRADPITTDGTYYEFYFGMAPSSAAACSPCTATNNPVASMSAGPPWTFSAAASLFVLDLGDTGDVFRAFDNGVSLGTTSPAPNPGTNPCGFNIGCAAGNALYSKGFFPLGPGFHSITIDVIQNAQNGPPNTLLPQGNAVFSVTATTTVVPEPSSLLVLAVTGALGISGAFLKKLFA